MKDIKKSTVRLSGIIKKFGSVLAVDDLNLEIESGQLVALLGPSGCGKTTTLRIIAGLEFQDRGHVIIGGKVVDGSPPWDRDCSMVFQSHALFPHMSVFDNIAYGLKERKCGKQDIERKISHVCELLDISPLIDRKPQQLSGGQCQRVALARALAVEPNILLMDEPLSSLDAVLREKLRFEIRELQKRTRITTVYVTHDQAEAFVVADKVVVLDRGRIQQIGNPRDIYMEPKNDFVANFIGSNNIIKGTIVETDEEDLARIAFGQNGTFVAKIYGQKLKTGQSVKAAIRSEDVSVNKINDKSKTEEIQKQNCYAGQVKQIAFLGDKLRLEVAVEGETIKADLVGQGRYSLLEIGQSVMVSLEDVKILASE